MINKFRKSGQSNIVLSQTPKILIDEVESRLVGIDHFCFNLFSLHRKIKSYNLFINLSMFH